MGTSDKQFQVIISDRAAEMLVQHIRFLALVNVEAAEKLRADLLEAMLSLHEFPLRGSWLSDPILPANKYRKLLVDKRFMIVYQIKAETVYIDYILDCRQDYGWLV